jgi:hypothetical protein
MSFPLSADILMLPWHAREEDAGLGRDAVVAARRFSVQSGLQVENGVGEPGQLVVP